MRIVGDRVHRACPVPVISLSQCQAWVLGSMESLRVTDCRDRNPLVKQRVSSYWVWLLIYILIRIVLSLRLTVVFEQTCVPTGEMWYCPPTTLWMLWQVSYGNFGEWRIFCVSPTFCRSTLAQKPPERWSLGWIVFHSPISCDIDSQSKIHVRWINYIQYKEQAHNINKRR